MAYEHSQPHPCHKHRYLPLIASRRTTSNSSRVLKYLISQPYVDKITLVRTRGDGDPVCRATTSLMSPISVQVTCIPGSLLSAISSRGRFPKPWPIESSNDCCISVSVVSVNPQIRTSSHSSILPTSSHDDPSQRLLSLSMSRGHHDCLRT